MLKKINCWEFMKCGREPGGLKVDEFGICPAATFEKSDGYLDGKNGGRGCAYITGTYCSGTIQGTKMDKSHNCRVCEFYLKLKWERKLLK